MLFLTCFFSFGCAKKEEPICGCSPYSGIPFLKAKVVQTSDSSCGKPVLDFSEDALKIRTLTNRDDLTYNVINLPEDFIVQDKKLSVTIIKPKPEEEFVCTIIGISPLHLKVADAKIRD